MNTMKYGKGFTISAPSGYVRWTDEPFLDDKLGLAFEMERRDNQFSPVYGMFIRFDPEDMTSVFHAAMLLISERHGDIEPEVHLYGIASEPKLKIPRTPKRAVI